MNELPEVAVERTSTRTMILVLTAIIVLIIVSLTVTAVFWLAGGEFQRSPALAMYAMVMIYMWTLVLKITIEKRAKISKMLVQ